MKNLALAFALAASAFAAQAQIYGEIGYTGVTYKDDDGIKGSPSAIRAVLGYELNSNLAVEGLVALGVGGSKVKYDGQSVSGSKFEVTNVVGIYLKPKAKLGSDVEVFGRIGYADGKVKASLEGESASVSENSFSYGAGFNYAINTKVSLNIDYMQYVKKSGGKANGYTLGVGYKF